MTLSLFCIKGDYTLDYNQEAQYYGVYSSNHGEHGAPYFPPITDWMPAARAMAQEHAKAGKFTCPPNALHFSCHLAPWGYQSYGETLSHRHSVYIPAEARWWYNGQRIGRPRCHHQLLFSRVGCLACNLIFIMMCVHNSNMTSPDTTKALTCIGTVTLHRCSSSTIGSTHETLLGQKSTRTLCWTG